MPAEKTDHNRSLARGIQLIEFLSNYPNGCPLAKIAELTGINKSTTHRLLKSLQRLGYVTPTSSQGSYRLTGRFIAVGQKTFASLDVIRLALPHMERLNVAFGDTVNLSVRETNHVILVHKLEPTVGGLRTRTYVGQRSPLYRSAMGKLYLAFSPEGYLDEYWESEKTAIVRLTRNTIVDKNVMRHELNRIRQEHVSLDREEHEIGIVCVASPLFGPSGSVESAISVSTPVARLDDDKKIHVCDTVLKTAAAISRELAGGA